MEQKKIKLSTINDGKEFVMPKPTVSGYEKYLAKLADMEKEGMKESEINVMSNKIMLWSLLQQLDENVQLSDINNLHPLDYQILLEEMMSVYDKGSEMGGQKNG